MIWRLFMLIAPVALAAGTAHAAPAMPCEKLVNMKLADVVRLEASPVQAGTLAPENRRMLDGGPLPAFCRVKAVIAPRINVEIWLPDSDWNGRLHGRGIGGKGGFIAYQDLADSLRRGFATATTDTGHAATDLNWGSKPDSSADLPALADYGWRSVHQMTVTAKAIITAYYGRPPRFSYFSGCSGGGRQGLTEVQRFPADYDGVLAGCAPMAFNRELATFLWPQIVMRARLGGPIAIEKLHALSNAVVTACDGDDGVVDGLVNDPRKCGYDPVQFTCAATRTAPNCLTPPEADAIRAIWAGPRSRNTGERIWFTPEKTVYAATWDKPYPIGIDLLKWVTGDPRADWTMITEQNFEDYVDRAVRKLGPTLDAHEPAIGTFIARGGKLLMWHGEADWADAPRGSINYFRRVLEINRKTKGYANAIRLFLMPGVEHCDLRWETLPAGGRTPSAAPFPSAQPLSPTRADRFPVPILPFPDRLFDALIHWVEQGVPPERVTASQMLAGGQIRTRPLCAFPKVAKWDGAGNPDNAASFTCVNGGQNRADFTTSHDR